MVRKKVIKVVKKRYSKPSFKKDTMYVLRKPVFYKYNV